MKLIYALNILRSGLIMEVIDVSKIKTGKEFSDIVFNSKDFCFQIVGEDENPVLSKMNEPELKNKFKIGDKVILDKELSYFNGIESNDIYSVVGMEIVENQILYAVRKGCKTYHFFGYELEKYE